MKGESAYGKEKKKYTNFVLCFPGRKEANETRQNNLQSATVSLQVVIGLCKRKETAALKSKPPFQMGVSNCLYGTAVLLIILGNYVFLSRFPLYI